MTFRTPTRSPAPGKAVPPAAGQSLPRPAETAGEKPRRRAVLRRCLPALVLAAALALPATAAAAADLDVVFVLDTTGSMSSELREVQDRVRQIAVSLIEARPDATIRFGIVAYRDRGDEYVTRVSPLDRDLETSRKFLATLRAGGGGDGPESVVAALAAALRDQPWNPDGRVERQIFLIGDAPPHLDYADEPTPDELIAEARSRRIVVNGIGCRSLPPIGVAFFRELSYATEGRYQHIGRVRAAEPGALAEAVTRTVAAPAIDDEGEEIDLAWTGHDPDARSAGILVELAGAAAGGQGAGACALEVRLPAGLGLAGDPVARLGRRGLEVRLDTEPDAEAGGRHVFELERCPPLATPIHVVLGAS